MPISSGAMDGKQDSYLKRYYRSLPMEERLMIEQSLMLDSLSPPSLYISTRTLGKVNHTGFKNAINDQAHVSGLEKGYVGGPTQVPDPQKAAIEHRNGADVEDSEANNPKEPSSKKTSTCIVL